MKAVQEKSKVRQSSDDVHVAAEQGTAGSGAALPHAERIQAAFGRHDVSDVQAYTGGAAREASNAIGAQAFATGSKVAFASAPDLHTAAHEAAHVVQQRAGVSLLGGVGQAGDMYEQHADRVADAVVQGRSAEGVLDELAPSGGAQGGTTAVQRVVASRLSQEHMQPNHLTSTGPFDREIMSTGADDLNFHISYTATASGSYAAYLAANGGRATFGGVGYEAGPSGALHNNNEYADLGAGIEREHDRALPVSGTVDLSHPHYVRGGDSETFVVRARPLSPQENAIQTTAVDIYTRSGQGLGNEHDGAFFARKTREAIPDPWNGLFLTPSEAQDFRNVLTGGNAPALRAWYSRMRVVMWGNVGARQWVQATALESGANGPQGRFVQAMQHITALGIPNAQDDLRFYLNVARAMMVDPSVPQPVRTALQSSIRGGADAGQATATMQDEAFTTGQAPGGNAGAVPTSTQAQIELYRTAGRAEALGELMPTLENTLDLMSFTETFAMQPGANIFGALQTAVAGETQSISTRIVNWLHTRAGVADNAASNTMNGSQLASMAKRIGHVEALAQWLGSRPVGSLAVAAGVHTALVNLAGQRTGNGVGAGQAQASLQAAIASSTGSSLMAVHHSAMNIAAAASGHLSRANGNQLEQLKWTQLQTFCGAIQGLQNGFDIASLRVQTAADIAGADVRMLRVALQALLSSQSDIAATNAFNALDSAATRFARELLSGIDTAISEQTAATTTSGLAIPVMMINSIASAASWHETIEGRITQVNGAAPLPQAVMDQVNALGGLVKLATPYAGHIVKAVNTLLSFHDAPIRTLAEASRTRLRADAEAKLNTFKNNLRVGIREAVNAEKRAIASGHVRNGNSLDALVASLSSGHAGADMPQLSLAAIPDPLIGNLYRNAVSAPTVDYASMSDGLYEAISVKFSTTYWPGWRAQIERLRRVWANAPAGG